MAGAIGKLPDGLRPPPRLVRGETVTCGGFAATPRLLPQKEGDHPRQRMVEDILFPPQLCVSQQKGLSSVSLTADSSLCGGSLWAALPAKPLLKGEVSAVGGRRGSFPKRPQVAAALSAAVTTAKSIGDRLQLHGHTSPKERTSLFPATLRERGSGGEALLLEKRPLPQNLPASLVLAEVGGICYTLRGFGLNLRIREGRECRRSGLFSRPRR